MCAEKCFIWGSFLSGLKTVPNLLFDNIILNMLQLIIRLFFTSHFNSGRRGRFSNWSKLTGNTLTHSERVSYVYSKLILFFSISEDGFLILSPTSEGYFKPIGRRNEPYSVGLLYILDFCIVS